LKAIYEQSSRDSEELYGFLEKQKSNEKFVKEAPGEAEKRRQHYFMEPFEFLHMLAKLSQQSACMQALLMCHKVSHKKGIAQWLVNDYLPRLQLTKKVNREFKEGETSMQDISFSLATDLAKEE